jgi:hypothetical protein
VNLKILDDPHKEKRRRKEIKSAKRQTMIDKTKDCTTRTKENQEYGVPAPLDISYYNNL